MKWILIITISALQAADMMRQPKPTEYHGHLAEVIDFATARKVILAKRSLSQGVPR